MRRSLPLLLVLPLVAACVDDAAAPAAPESAPTLAGRLALAAGRPSLDYRNPDLWACSPAAGDVCDGDFRALAVGPEGTTAAVLLPAEREPAIDCFFIYPTVDLNLQPGNHDDMGDVELPRRIVEAQAARFNAACRVIAPFYRQGTIGSYSAPTPEAVAIFSRAFADVAAAFEYYLEHWNAGRPLVIVGHSQGAQMSSYLLHRYFEGTTTVTEIPGSATAAELQARLVAALPIGFNVFTAPGRTAGGSFAEIPVCTAPEQTGCVIHYRSFSEGHDFDRARAGGFAVDQVLAERGYLHRGFGDDDALVCINPATEAVTAVATILDLDDEPVAPNDSRVLAASEFLGAVGFLSSSHFDGFDLGRHERRFAATCRRDAHGNGYLAIGHHLPAGLAEPSDDPIPLDGAIATANLGLHLWDFNLAMADLVEQIRTRRDAYLDANP